MRIRPFDELETQARRAYAARWAKVSARAPRIINAEALVRWDRPRAFVHGGVGYRAPPLSFRLGVRLLIATHALRDLRSAPLVSATRTAHARHIAALCCRQAVTPRAWWRRVGWPYAHATFAALELLELESLGHWLLEVPDESPPPPPQESPRPPLVDLVDALAGFAREFPAWLGPDGLPRSWAHYTYGLRHLGRARHREDLRRAMSVRAAGADRKPYREWFAEWQAAAGW